MSAERPAATLLDQLETQARNRATVLHARGKLPHPEDCGYGALTRSELRELRRYKNCDALATDVDTYVALCKGRPVHTSRLAPEVVRLWRRR